MGHVLGAQKGIFLIRDIDGPAMTAASVESCRFVVLRSPRGRLGSVVDMCNRLRRMRGRFHRYIHMATLPARHLTYARDVNIFIWSSRKSVGHKINDRFMVHGKGTRADGPRS